MFSIVNWWSLASVHLQRESPVWGCSEEGNGLNSSVAIQPCCGPAPKCYSSIMKQRGWLRSYTAVRGPWGQAPLQLDSSAMLFSSETAAVFQLQLGNIVSGHRWKGKACSQSQRPLAYIHRSPHPWSLIGPSSCKWWLQILTVWLV